jgi:hypothetical protein
LSVPRLYHICHPTGTRWPLDVNVSSGFAKARIPLSQVRPARILISALLLFRSKLQSSDSTLALAVTSLSRLSASHACALVCQCLPRW